VATEPIPSVLNDCGCCAGIEQETPQVIWNRPGLRAIAYRVGTHQQFKASLLARIQSSRQVALQRLQTRRDDDFTIALLDSFSTVADVLTFYSERIANDAYLRTAVERRSVLELAQLIGYQLSPGVAASTFLAFTMDDAPGALGTTLLPPTTAQVQPEVPLTITIDVGTKVQSIPGPGEKPQTFETVERIDARADWNAIQPRLTQPQVVSTSSQSFILAGAINTLKKGDKILVRDDQNPDQVLSILNVSFTTDPVAIANNKSTTQIDVAILAPGTTGYNPATYNPASTGTIGKIDDFALNAELTDAVASKIIAAQWEADTLIALAKIQKWPLDQLAANINKQLAQSQPAASAGVWVFRQRAAAFGYNAPIWDSIQPGLRVEGVFQQAVVSNTGTTSITVPIPAPYGTSWEGLNLDHYDNCAAGRCALYLDNTYPEIVPGSWIALLSPDVNTGVASVLSNTEVAHSEFTLSAKVSMLTVHPPALLSSYPIRDTAILCQSELLALAPVPITNNKGEKVNVIVLDRAYLGLTTGRKVVISGERDDLPGVSVAEVRTLQEVTLQNGFTVITLDSELDHSYVRSSIRINANVALSSNGETVQEILGSGDGAQTFQSYVLQQTPLTYISANSPTGIQTTLEIRVDDMLWQEVPFFYGHGPEEHIYITREDDAGKTTVMFGDGVSGTRLPTGQQNVKAKYRRGIGLGGLVRANQLSLLLSRPLGLKAANNPLPAAGAADPEKLDEARRNATLTIMTLGRIVSLDDYQDFARAFAGIGKALASWTWSGQQRTVLLTVAGADGVAVPASGTLYQNLLAAIHRYSEPFVTVLLNSYDPIFFRISGSVTVKPDFLVAKVAADVESALRDAFSFDARDFGQPVHLSEVIATIQNVNGVLDVDLSQFYRSDLSPDLVTHIPAAVPRPGKNEFFAAQLLTLDSRPLGLEVTE
jgi:hypothetical protein